MGNPGELPPNSSDEEDDDSDSDDSDIQPLGAGKAKEAPEPPRRKKNEDEVDPAQVWPCSFRGNQCLDLCHLPVYSTIS